MGEVVGVTGIMVVNGLPGDPRVSFSKAGVCSFFRLSWKGMRFGQGGNTSVICAEVIIGLGLTEEAIPPWV